MRAIFLGTLLSTLIHWSASADAWEDQQIEMMSHISSVELGVIDGVKDGCWRTPDATKSVVKKALSNAGIKVKEDDADVYLVLTGNGAAPRTPDGRKFGCQASLIISGFYFANAFTPDNKTTVFTKIEFFNQNVIFGGPANLQRNFNDSAQQIASQFVILWLKSRQR